MCRGTNTRQQFDDGGWNIFCKRDEVRFRFELADDKKIEGLDHLDVSLRGKEVRQLWENFRKTKRVEKESENRDMLQEDMEQFHNTIRAHVRKTTKLRLDDRSVFVLTQVWLPILSLSNKGNVRIEKDCKKEIVNYVLHELSNLCQLLIHTANPRISACENSFDDTYNEM